MGIGVGIFLIALGAIVAFGLNFQPAGINLDVIGWVLMLSGVLGIVLTMVYWRPRRAARNESVVEERYYAADPHIPQPPDTE
jgi:hypothetical protein